jgi:hypothetical protein
MSEDVTFVGTYAIPEGSLDEWKGAIVDMIDFVKASVPRLISFSAYVNDDGTEATSIYVHPDSVSLERHLEMAASRISAGVRLVRTRRIELYGSPSDRVVEQLHRISETAGGFPVTVKARFYGS